MLNIKNLSNTELVNQYNIAKKNFINAIEGTPEEIEADKLYSELFQEIKNRDLDLRDYIANESKATNTTKSIKNIITTTILTIAILLSVNPTQASAQEINSQIVNTHINYRSDIVAEYSDGMATVINNATNVYELYIPASLGDYNYTCNSQQELDNLILEYKSHIEDPEDLVNTIKDIQEVNRYIKSDGNTEIVEFNNNSWSLVNKNTNTYIFTLAETTDFEINCKDEKELNNLIETYKLVKLNGWY